MTITYDQMIEQLRNIDCGCSSILDAAADALQALHDRNATAEPVAWMVGDNPDTAAIYNRSKREDAFDAARRWNCSITALTTAPGAPEFTVKA